jgi:hypothetical protein
MGAYSLFSSFKYTIYNLVHRTVSHGAKGPGKGRAMKPKRLAESAERAPHTHTLALFPKPLAQPPLTTATTRVRCVDKNHVNTKTGEGATGRRVRPPARSN